MDDETDDVPVEWTCTTDCEVCSAMEGEYEPGAAPDRPHDFCECLIDPLVDLTDFSDDGTGSFLYVDLACYRIEVTEVFCGFEDPDSYTIRFYVAYDITCKKGGEDDTGESRSEDEEFSVDYPFHWSDIMDQFGEWLCGVLEDADADAQSLCGTDCSG